LKENIIFHAWLNQRGINGITVSKGGYNWFRLKCGNVKKTVEHMYRIILIEKELMFLYLY